MTWTVAEFLRVFQQVIEAHQNNLPCHVWWDGDPRRVVEINDIKLKYELVLEELLKLKPGHHFRGPESDDWEQERAAVHKFRYPVPAGVEAYVKIGLKEVRSKPGTYVAKIYSFKRWE